MLQLKSSDGRRAQEARTAGFPLRLVSAQGVDPGVDQGVDQGVDPGVDQGVDPGVDQGVDPGVDPGVPLGIGGVRLRVGDHAALLYLTPEERIRALVAALVEGLRAGDRIVHVVNDQPVGAWVRALAAAGLDVAARVAEGHLAIVSSDEVFFRDGRFDPVAALARVRELAQPLSAPRTRLFVDMTYLLARVPGIERGLELEARMSEALRGLALVRICAFDAGGEISDRLADVLRDYPTVIGEGGSLWNPYYRPWNELRMVRKAAHLARPIDEAK